ncbi:hypothetical protein [Alistipes sp. ZOR0009]|uniref:hypothetical protein n=1 Tax=Alistipes sp. ZOR0009 TaxID=1339253 RepID=UPI0006460E0F|nr:hypothetical protein [Alistipes sp. ZOR0009]
MWFRNKKSRKQEVSLSQIIADFKEALNRSQEAHEKYQLARVKEFYNADGTLKTTRFKAEDGMEMEIPNCKLVNHSILHLDEFRMQFQARIGEVKLDGLRENYAEMVTAPLLVTFSEMVGGSQIQVEISYKKNKEETLLLHSKLNEDRL